MAVYEEVRTTGGRNGFGQERPSHRSVRSGDETARLNSLPSGGPLELDARVAELFLTQIEIVCFADDERRQERAVRRRDDLLLRLGRKQKDYASLICDVVQNLCSR